MPNNGCKINGNSQHPGQRRGSVRKLANKLRKVATLANEAKRLGISVEKLKFQKAQEGFQIIAEQRQAEASSVRHYQENQSRRRPSSEW